MVSGAVPKYSAGRPDTTAACNPCVTISPLVFVKQYGTLKTLPSVCYRTEGALPRHSC